MAGQEGIKAGRAYVQLGTNQSELEKGLLAAEKRVKDFGVTIGKIGAAISGIGAAITAPLIYAAETFAKTGADLLILSQRTGISVESLSKLSFAASQTGTDIDSVEIAIRRMEKALLSGSEENLQAEATFASLGLSVEKLITMKPDQAFNEIAGAIGRIPNPTARAGAAMQVFGRQGTVLLPLIQNIGELNAKASEFGLTMSTETAESAHKLEQSIRLLGSVMTKIVSTVGSALAPSFEQWNTWMSRIGKTIIDFIRQNKGLIVAVSTVGFSIVALGAVITALGVAIYGAGAAMGVLASVAGIVVTVFGALASPVGMIIVDVAALTVAFLGLTETGQQITAFLGEQFGILRDDAMAAFTGIADALKSGDIRLAGQILWAGLRLEWLKGVQFLMEKWDEFGRGSIEAFRGISFGIAGLFIDLWAKVQTAHIARLGQMQGAWSSFIGFMAKAFNTFGGVIAKIWERIKHLFVGGDLDAQIKEINDATARANAAQDQVTAEGEAGRSGERKKKFQAIEDVRGGARAALAEDEKTEKQNRFKKSKDDIAAAALDLANAQEDFQGFVGLAKNKAAIAGAPKGEGKEKPFTPENLNRAIEKTKVDVSGSFQASALRGLGAGSSVQDDTLKEAKKTNEELHQLNKKADRGALVFQ